MARLDAERHKIDGHRVLHLAFDFLEQKELRAAKFNR